MVDNALSNVVTMMKWAPVIVAVVAVGAKIVVSTIVDKWVRA